MERIHASHTLVDTSTAVSSSPSAGFPLLLPTPGVALLGSHAGHAIAIAQPPDRRPDGQSRDEDIGFCDSDVSSVASSNVPLDDLSDDWRPVSPPRRPTKLALSPLTQESLRRSPSPQASPTSSPVGIKYLNPERQARVRRTNYVSRDSELRGKRK